MRFLTALACLGHGEFRLDGSPRMRERPIGPLVDGLRTLGAPVGYEEEEGFPPVLVRGQGLLGGEVTLADLPSSQFISALLMVAPYARQDVLMRVLGDLPSQPYLAMTIAAMRSLGVELVESEGRRFVVPAYQHYQGREVEIEPDASSATYLWAAAAITGGQVQVAGLTRRSNQGDTRFIDVLAQMGCVVEEDDEGIAVAAPSDGKLRGIAVDLNDMPDAAQTLAVVALFGEGPTEIRNVGTLRVKETDRVAALATELERLGAEVTTTATSLTIRPPAQITHRPRSRPMTITAWR